MKASPWVGLVIAALAPSVSHAQTIASRTETTPFAGVRVIVGRTASPATSFRATIVSLCNDFVHVTATRAPTALQRTSTWASAAGVQVATNGDFFTAGPRIYGYAIGNGAAWPVRQTGVDPAVAGEWYYRRYGWIGFGPGAVEFSHTEWVKQHAAGLGVADGWMPTTVTTGVPRGLTALVSGFPELITEGQRYACAVPTAATCFPDRTDMRARNPRTAMGLTRDRRTFLLVTVDGRSATSAGMYGTEMARLMELLGAWQAFNLDGGGSTTMWVRGRGVINTPSDATGERLVANHWGIFAGSADGRPRAPGSCRVVTTTDAGVRDAGALDASVRDAGGRDAGTDGASDLGGRDALVDRASVDVGRDVLFDLGDLSDEGRPRIDVGGDVGDAPSGDAGPRADTAPTDESTLDDAGAEDADPAEELPEFADAASVEMPPAEVVDAPAGCGCRAAQSGSAGLPGAMLGWVLGALALTRRRARRG